MSFFILDSILTNMMLLRTVWFTKGCVTEGLEVGTLDVVVLIHVWRTLRKGNHVIVGFFVDSLCTVDCRTTVRTREGVVMTLVLN